MDKKSDHLIWLFFRRSTFRFKQAVFHHVAWLNYVLMVSRSFGSEMYFIALEEQFMIDRNSSSYNDIT